MMKKYSLMLAASLVITIVAMAQQEARLLRFPATNGSEIVFTYAGDLYSVNAKGGMARKLTSDEGFEMFPRFSPDGSQIAFTAQYDGNTEVYLIPATGGVPERLTHTATLGRDDISDRMGPNNIVMTWHPDGSKIYFRSRKQTFNSFVGHLFSVSPEGGLPEEVPLSTGGFCSWSPDGSKLAFNRVFREFRTWKYYEGGMADDIRIFEPATGEVSKITDNDKQDIMPMWWKDEIYFISDRDRTMNIFAYNTQSGETRKVTNYTKYDVKFPSLGRDAIVYENGGYIYYLDLNTQESRKVSIQIANDMLNGRDELKDASDNIFSYEIAPDGNRALFSARGDIWTVPAESGITRNLTASSGAHDRNPKWSPDGKYIAFISDMSGEYEIYIIEGDGSGEPQQITSGAETYKYRLRWSPDSKKLLWSDKMLRLRYVDIETKKVALVAKSDIWEYNSFAWSPDSKWISYADPQKNGMDIIKIYNTETEKTFDITEGWYDSGDPVFSENGKYLFFVSERDFNPIYSATEWNHAYGDMSKLFMITLAKGTPSPFAPENDEVAIKEEKEQEKEQEKKEDSESVKVDTEGIKDRVIGIPVKTSNYRSLSSVGNKLFYVEMSRSDFKSTLKFYDLDKEKETEVGPYRGYEISADGKKMLIGAGGGKYAIIDLPGGPAKMDETLDLSGMKVWVNKKEEWEQIFEESWRQMRDFFYVPNMHGLDWKAMKEKYEVLVPYVNDRNDLNYVIGELIGELNVGHAYVNGGDKAKPEKIKTGLLGAKLSKHSSGYFRIDKILKGQNWNKGMRSPLSEIGVDAAEGDFITAVNGQSTKDMADIYAALVGEAGKQVELTLNSEASEGGRDVIVVPIADESDLYYYNWVQENIRKVNEATDGQVGYIHVPDMGPGGLNEFVKHFYPQLNKKALIIDDRGNGGGNVSPMIIERLRRAVTRANMARNVNEPGQTPRQMMLGPKVLLINQYSASDGDLFPYSFKRHGLGKVIGIRTWGGVVGIRGSLPFIDGADLRKPEFASYSADTSDWIIEGIGVEPDIVVDNDPHQEYLGKDAQLEKAIEVILQELKDYQGVPPIPEGPDKTK